MNFYVKTSQLLDDADGVLHYTDANYDKNCMFKLVYILDRRLQLRRQVKTRVTQRR